MVTRQRFCFVSLRQELSDPSLWKTTAHDLAENAAFMIIVIEKNQNDTSELIKDKQNIFPQESRENSKQLYFSYFICNQSGTMLKRIMIVSEWNENQIELMKGHDVRFIFFTEKITPIFVFKNNPILPQRSLPRPACKKKKLSCHFWTHIRNRSVHTKEKTAGKQHFFFGLFDFRLFAAIQRFHLLYRKQALAFIPREEFKTFCLLASQEFRHAAKPRVWTSCPPFSSGCT